MLRKTDKLVLNKLNSVTTSGTRLDRGGLTSPPDTNPCLHPTVHNVRPKGPQAHGPSLVLIYYQLRIVGHHIVSAFVSCLFSYILYLLSSIHFLSTSTRIGILLCTMFFLCVGLPLYTYLLLPCGWAASLPCLVFVVGYFSTLGLTPFFGLAFSSGFYLLFSYREPWGIHLSIQLGYYIY